MYVRILSNGRSPRYLPGHDCGTLGAAGPNLESVGCQKPRQIDRCHERLLPSCLDRVTWRNRHMDVPF